MAKTAAALHILVKEEKLALDLLEQIKNGADFGKLAKKHSICPSGKRGGGGHQRPLNPQQQYVSYLSYSRAVSYLPAQSHGCESLRSHHAVARYLPRLPE